MPYSMDDLTRKIGSKIEKARVKVNAYRYDKGFGTFPKLEKTLQESIAKRKAERYDAK